MSDGSYGGMLTRLLFRHLPNHYPSGSAYAHFPFLVPGKMKSHAQKLPGDVDLEYDWNRPAVPVGRTIVKTSYSEVHYILANPAIFTSGVVPRLEILTGGVPLKPYITHVGPALRRMSSNLISTPKVEDVLTKPNTLERATKAFERISHKLIEQKASGGAGPLDIVREVINLIPVYWLSNDIVR